jgi:hypothetical protein
MTTSTSSQSLWRSLLPHTMGSVDVPDAETARAYKLAVADASVRSLVFACANELKQLVEEGASEHFMHAAIQGAAMIETTPAEWLKTQLGMLRAEIESVRHEGRCAKDRRLQENQARKPLADAVDRLGLAAQQERETLSRRLADALGSKIAKKARHQELREAGLSEAEISALKLPPEDQAEEEQRALVRQRIAILDEQLARCKAYAVDPLHDPEHARGLGFDDLVDAQLADKAVVA